MPTTVWSVLLILVGAYWILSLVSGMDLEHVDGVDALDALDALDAADGLDGLHLDVIDHADALEGLDGGLDGLDAADGFDAHDGLDGDHGHGLLAWLGFHDVPKTFSVTLIVFFGWLVSFFGAAWLVDAGKWAALGLGTVLVLGFASLTVAIGMTAVALVPLRRFAVLQLSPERVDLLGETCIVKTTRVDNTFGQAETGSGRLVQVRARDGHAYRYGEPAIIFDYDRDREVFYIAPLDADLGSLSGVKNE